jgi:nitroreductase/NAD-dependent dihydropyrimidine dehydrogenase PreA subunit
MSVIKINSEKCKKDGICVAECPLGIIGQVDSDHAPELLPGTDEMCISCGHCVAVCPHGAMSHEKMSPEDCPPVKKDLLLSPEQVEYFIRARRSIRVYKDKAVDKDILLKLIELSMYAPSGHNSQAVDWRIVYDRDEVQRYTGMVIDWMRSLIEKKSPFVEQLHLDMIVKTWESGKDTVSRNAPHLVIVHGAKADVTAVNACIIAMTYFEFAAPSFGLGGCWGGFFNTAINAWKPLKEALGIPEDHSANGMMMIGYPEFKYHRLPLRNDPRVKIL